MKIAGSDDPEGALETQERKIAREAMAELGRSALTLARFANTMTMTKLSASSALNALTGLGEVLLIVGQ